jgi:aryl-alcohol dehydrogenase-like predicted oxidoreductase
MRTRQLGKFDVRLTTLGLGTWAIGGPWQYGWGAQDDDESLRTILAAVEAGVNWIDTAPIYGCGHSESIVGRAVRGMTA